jgi:hypothetical protein
MYIKGACKDEQAPFPQLRRCQPRARCRCERGPLVSERQLGGDSELPALL